MPCYDVETTAVVGASPAEVWDALLSELRGARRWWVPTHTFRPGVVDPEQVGGEVHVSVHVAGVGRVGPRLDFTARTWAVERERRLAAEYVHGCFRGVCEYRVEPVTGASDAPATQLTMVWSAEPHGWVRPLPVDAGAEHRQATERAFARLGELLADRRAEPVGAGVGGR